MGSLLFYILDHHSYQEWSQVMPDSWQAESTHLNGTDRQLTVTFYDWLELFLIIGSRTEDCTGKSRWRRPQTLERNNFRTSKYPKHWFSHNNSTYLAVCAGEFSYRRILKYIGASSLFSIWWVLNEKFSIFLKADTCYSDGTFIIDIVIPNEYPFKPPKVSKGLRQ